MLRPYFISLPVTVAGPRRIRTGFRKSPFARTSTRVSLGRRRRRRKRLFLQRPDELDTHGYCDQQDQKGDHRLRAKFSRGQLNLDDVARFERTGAIRREAPLLELLYAESLEFGRRDRGGGILDQQVELGGRLIDRDGERSCVRGKRVRVAELFHGPGRNRRQDDDTVMAKYQRVRRDIALPAAKLAAARRNAARPRRHERVPRDARGLPGVLELEDLQNLASPVFTGVRNRREPAREFDRWTVGRGRIREDVIGVHSGMVDVDRR